ncbi:MAG: thioesterase domain-containing protein [Ferruginibacter sp.]
MSDSVLNETIQQVQQASQKREPKQLNSVELDKSSGQYLSYFRHKGIKVKFEDIEEALLGCDLVSQAVVLSDEDREGNRRLVAYIIPKGAFNQFNIEQYLIEKLPTHMIPALWVCMEKFPTTPNGKTDRNALHMPATSESTCKEYIAPRNEMEAKLADIIRNFLGVDVVSIEDNFFRLGGGSLQALQVISAIRKDFDLDLDIKYFFVYPTIAELAVYLSKLTGKNVVAQPGNHGADNKKQKWTFDPDRSIVPIKAGSSKRPLYIVCGGGGTAFTFEKFACMLDDDQPVYGFQQPSGIKQLETFPLTIEDIAAKYVDEMLLLDPEGPYALSGHCIGGVIALEMARKLQAMGKKIKLLAMFDVILSKDENLHSATPKQLNKIPWIIKRVAARVYLKIAFETFLWTKHPKEAIEYKINRLKSFVNKIYRFQKEDVGIMVFKQFEQKFENAFEHYQVKKYDRDILVFYAREHYYFLDKNRNIRYKKFLLEEDIKNRWMKYARHVTMYEIEGEHSTIFEPFNSKEFVRLLQQQLNQP